jgi:nucleoside 2-deoxyribosyltransferase
MAQRWLINEARRSLRGAGLRVLSPFHDIGHGPAEFVGPPDVAALKKSDAVFAILDGLDSGTVFEIGFARALGKSVYVFSQNVAEEDLKMVVGTDCNVFNDFVTAIFAIATRS